MRKMGPVEKWLLIRESIRELQERNTIKETAKQKPKKKKKIVNKKRRIK